MKTSEFEFNWDSVRKRLEEIGEEKAENIHRNVELAIEKGARKIERDAALRAPVDEGRLRDEIDAKKSSGSGVNVVWEIICPVEYAPYIEFGTRPHWAPYGPILEWVIRKGLAVDDNDAFYVADSIRAKIAKYGTRPQPFMRPAFYKNERFIRSEIQQAVKDGLSED